MPGKLAPVVALAARVTGAIYKGGRSQLLKGVNTGNKRHHMRAELYFISSLQAVVLTLSFRFILIVVELVTFIFVGFPIVYSVFPVVYSRLSSSVS